ncbi:MAG: hypothetical protein ABI972_13600 [Acidobacteriota bacterium]
MLVSLTGCSGIVTWRTAYSSAPSYRHDELLVQETNCFPADCEVQVVVQRGWQSQQIAHEFDCVIHFAHAAWSGSVVAVFVDGFYCGQIKVAYDTETKRKVDFESAQAWLKPAIVEAYNVTAEELKANDGDVFKWATYPGDGESRRSVREFGSRFRRH